ncbi:VCBS domain-containing protein [Pseudomonas sp. PDM25]|uniref:VCBS domain-containing protein n=1 Tax=Pseudomonas sp. PDM25 TaxID=2854772 RepID=UPI001C4800B2|nr:VCBS domain-containing protein [Pseudomonas sp. PDM25]MBV7515346.1 VCBS domain-containing protein [Pseudomonas sp. PDM25]
MATTTTTSGGTVTSLSNTAQAQDDIFTTGVIGASTAAITEDLLGVVYLDVMSNDLGGNAKTLWSLDDATSLSTATKIYAPADLLIQDTGRIEATSTDTSFNGAKIWISSDGKVGYDAATLSTAFKAQLQSLAAGGSLTDSFTYAIRLGNGTLSWATAQVQFAGVNDAVTIGIGAQSGTVTEEPTTTSSLTDSLNATGTIAFNDVDLSDTHTASFVAAGGNTTALGNFVLAPVSEAANAANGTVNWTYTLNNAAAQHLAQGQTATETYVVTLNDGHGSTTTQNVTITITGTNDQVQITSGVQAGDAKEDSGDYAANGSITFTDVDRIDTHSVSVTPGASGYLGSFTLHPLSDSTGTGSGSLDWNFAVSNTALQFLGEGQSVTQTYNVVIGDGAVQTVTITITGTNDQVQITSGVQAGDAKEDSGDYAANGSITFSDVDLIDTHSVSVTPGASGYLGSFTTDPLSDSTGTGSGSLGWHFAVNNAALQFLGEGQTRTQTYNVAIGDGTVQTVTITITGTNDQPTLTIVDSTGAMNEGNGTATLSDSGALSFADLDSTDTVTVSQTANNDIVWSAGVLNAGVASALVAGFSVDQNSWDYSSHQNLDFLGAGETITFSYAVVATDDSGAANAASATQTVTITIIGTNDAPVLSFATGNDAGAVQEDTTLSVSGQLSSADIDHAATSTWTINGSASGTYGSIAVDSTGKWTYTLANGTDGVASAVQSLKAGESHDEVFSVQVSDGQGGVDTQLVTVTVSGTNDAAVLSSASVTLTETDAPLTTNGTLAISDVDSAATFVAQSNTAGSYGQFSLGTDGAWSYVADSAHNEFAAGTTYTDTFTVSSADGTLTSVTVHINGTNDAAVLSSASVMLTETDAPLTTAGILTISDVDSAATFVAQSNTAGSYGQFSLGTNGAWSYVADSAHNEFAAGSSYTDTFAVSSADGTATAVTVTITGSNDAAALSSASVTLTETDAPLTTNGTLAISDVDSAATFVAQSNTAGSYGQFSLGTDGAWSYVADSAHNEFAAGTTYTDTFTVSSADGTLTSVTVHINGTNDAAVLSSASVMLTETDAPLTTAGILTISDVDSAATFVAQSNTAGSYGQFSLGTNGAWSYVADSAHNEFAAGSSYTDTFAVSSADGTATAVTVTITGSNDAAALSSASVTLTETDAALTTAGTLTISDVDSAATFVAQSNTAGSYGQFSLGTDGAWSYVADSAHNEFAAGTTYTDTFTVSSADGTLTSVTVHITGTNDAAVLSADIANLTETDAPLTTAGTLTISDVDSAATFVAQSNTAGSYGQFSLGTDGAWSYVADSAHNEFAAGTTYTDTFTVSSADGTATAVTVTITGSNDAAVLSADITNLIETNAPLTTNGTLSISDVDSAATFVAQSGTAGSYGQFSLGTDGAWSYVADSAHNEFAAGSTYTDTFTVSSADGTLTSVTVHINGTNDAAVLSSASVTLTETDAAADISTTGTLSISDVDSAATFVAQSNTAGSYGQFSLGTDGAWSYVADSAHNEFIAGTTYTDTFTVSSADGTLTSVTVHILGSNDAAVLSSTSVTLTETDAPLTTNGTLTISDVDSAATFIVQSNTAGSYGQFSLGTDGAWTYVANSAHNEFAAGTTYTDTFAVSSADGTLTSVTVHISGTNDAPVMTTGGSLSYTENQTTTAINSALTITDIDSSNLTGATVSITSNFATGQDILAFTNQNGITGSYNAGTGVLTLTGAATVVQYQAALRSVTYSNSSDNPSTTARTISFQVDDGAAANHASNVATTTVTVSAVNDAPTTSGLAITETSISFVAADPDNATLSLQSPFAAAFGNPSITSGASTNLSPVEQGSVVSGTLQVKDGSVAAGVVELYLGTSAGNNFSAGSSDTAIYGFGGTDNLSGGAGADWIFGGAGNDVIVGAANDRLLDGGTGTDTLNVGSVFVNTSDSQIANIENIQLTAASGVLTLNAQTESFTIFGTSGADQIVAGSGNDTIFGTDNDTLLDGGTGSDTLSTGALFTSTSDGQITGIENVLIGTASTLNLSNQTEGFTITGSSGVDTITGGTGADSISAAGGNDIINGAQNDTLLDGGTNTDTLNVSANFTSTSNAQIANIENVTLTTSGLTLNLGNQTEAFNINGSSGVDNISGGSGADTINGQAGNDTLTGNGGADQFRLRTNGGTDTITDYTDNTDKIGFLGGAVTGGVGFTTVGSSSGTALLSADFQTRNSISNININDDNKIDVIDSSSQTTAQITTGTGGGATNTYVIVFNSTTGKGEIWFDTDWSNTASRVQVATLNNVTTLAGVANITASDIVVHDNTFGPAGIAGSPINLGLADAVTHAGVTTVSISGLPAGWTLNQGSDNGNGTWTVDQSSLDTLTVTTAADFVGARVLPVTMTWTNADGTVESEVIRDNVEAYAPGSPIFALSADDNLTGSSSADLFVFAQPIGNNVIHSFDAAADKIDLIGFTGVTGYADLSIANDANGDALVNIGSDQTVTLKGVDAADLSEANFQFDVDPLTNNTGTLSIADGAIMPFGGSIHNSGTIELGSAGSATHLEILFRGATLTGGGQVQLSDSAQNVIFGGSADTVLTNVDNRITGAGQLGAGQMVLVNAGLILASGVNSLVLDTGTHTITNSGVLESTGTGGMTVASAVDNSGHLWANGSDLHLLADVTGNGSATIDGDATLSFDGTAHTSVAFHGEGAGTLVIAQAEAAGSLVGILGLESDDMLTFGDLAFGANTQLSYNANASGAGGLLTVDDGVHRAEVNLLGHYSVNDFQATDGGEAGTQVSYHGESSGTLVGTMAADVISGGDGNDIIVGRGGEDTLSGGAGADMFAYFNVNEGGDHILDYNFAEGDTVDLSALLNANFVNGTSQVSDFVQLAQSGSDITVKVDVDGAANGTNFADVAVLANTGTSGTDLVRTWFGEADHTLTA